MCVLSVHRNVKDMYIMKASLSCILEKSHRNTKHVCIQTGISQYQYLKHTTISFFPSKKQLALGD